MELFDLYYYSSSDNSYFSPSKFQLGQKIWLDGCDGFFDQYFEAFESESNQHIRFVPIADSLESLRDLSSLEELWFLEAKIVDNYKTDANVVITALTTLGRWARRTPLQKVVDYHDLPKEVRPTSALFNNLRRDANLNQCALWTSNRKYWKSLSEISAVYIFRTVNDLRCLILTTNAVPSYLFKVAELS